MSSNEKTCDQFKGVGPLYQSKAPGKVILHGEYAVVYGQHALAVSLGLHTLCTVQACEEDFIVLRLLSLDFNLSVPTDEVEKFDFDSIEENSPKMAVKAILQTYKTVLASTNKSSCPMVIQVTSELPAGAGLGSSAAFATSVVAGILSLVRGKCETNLDEISSMAYQCELVFHGKPSGIDNSICTYGGAILFQDGQVKDKLKAEELPKLDIMLVYTGVSRNTKQLIEKVSKFREESPDQWKEYMTSIDKLSLSAWDMIKEHKYNKAERDFIVLRNQEILNNIGAGHEKINEIVSIAEKELHFAKLTGAGGGGCVLVHLNGEPSADMKKELFDLKCFHWTTSFGGPGVGVTTN